jgi:AraC family transcriptional regulator
MPALLPSTEAPAWPGIDGTWRRINSDFADRGLSIAWHDFSSEADLDWAANFHRESLGICLNFAGDARLGDDRALGPEQATVYLTGHRAVRAQRCAGRRHRFFTFEFSADFLRQQLGADPQGVRPEVRDFLEKPERSRAVLDIGALPVHLLHYRRQLLEPPIYPPGHAIWYQGKAAELISHFLYVPPAEELFCERHKRFNRERCERVLFLIERDLENPPSLDMLAVDVQCSSFYLSRLFVQQTGMSIPRYLRVQRLEKAGALLRAGKTSVTDAAMTVGYSSLSSFNKAFVAHFGCCPGLYPHAKTLLKRTK